MSSAVQRIDMSLDEIIANKNSNKNSGKINLLTSKSRKNVGSLSLDEVIKQRQKHILSLAPNIAPSNTPIAKANPYNGNWSSAGGRIKPLIEHGTPGKLHYSIGIALY